MYRKKNSGRSTAGRNDGRRTGAIALAIGSLLATSGAAAFELATGGGDGKVRWDNTVKYSTAFRVKDPSAGLTNDANQDDGNRNFDRGVISSRVDLLSEFDFVYRNVGARISGAAWYDAAYNGSTDNPSPFTYNPDSVPNTRFARAVRDLHGRKAELLDAFLFAKGEMGDMPVSARLGRHALVYGESLFFGNNGIANAQQPIDVVKALSVPNTQFKELIRPVGQVSAQLQLQSNLSVGGYYQYRWEKTRLPAAGSYFSGVDFFDAGGERILTGPASALRRAADLKAKDAGQGGLQLRCTPDGSGVDLGLYAVRYHDKTPQVVIQPRTGTYALAYHENIRSYGASASTSLGDYNLAGEVSVRRNTPLVNAGSTDLFGLVPPLLGGPSTPADNADHPSYPVGNSAHAQLSVLASMGQNVIAREASLVGEIAWNRRTSVTRNAGALDPDASRDAWGMRLVYEPGYRQVVSGLDISVPLGVSYFPKGKSSVVTAFGPDRGGDISLGMNGTYLSIWSFGLNYTHYYGREDNGSRTVAGHTVYTYAQNFKDRDFISATVRTTF